MRHGKKFNHLGRKSAHRQALLANLACDLIEHKRINTTVAKAKALRKYVEPLLTKSKVDSTHSRRTVFSYLQNKDVLTELFREVAPKIADRPGGYVRIIKTGNRQGDNAEMALIELVDFNTLYVKEEKTTKAKRTRRKKSTTTDAPVAEAAEVTTAPVAEETVEETPAKEAPEASAEDNTTEDNNEEETKKD